MEGDGKKKKGQEFLLLPISLLFSVRLRRTAKDRIQGYKPVGCRGEQSDPAGEAEGREVDKDERKETPGGKRTAEDSTHTISGDMLRLPCQRRGEKTSEDTPIKEHPRPTKFCFCVRS